MRYHRGEILWMVMLILLIIALSASRIALMQAHAQRLLQWEDQQIRTQQALEQVLSRYVGSPAAFPGGSVPINEELMSKPLSYWQAHPYAIHAIGETGIEVHVIMESIRGTPVYFRLNGLGYHPAGTLIKKQCLFACYAGTCLQLSTHAV